MHRDIKPDNVLIFTDERKIITRAKLADFGLSTHVTHTTMVTNMGTLPYMAPELFNADGSVDLQSKAYTPASDVWSFGVVVLAVLLERQPYGDTESIDSLQSAPLSYMDKVLNLVRKAYDCPLKSLMMSCLQEKPRHRSKMTNIVKRLDDLYYESPRSV